MFCARNQNQRCRDRHQCSSCNTPHLLSPSLDPYRRVPSSSHPCLPPARRCIHLGHPVAITLFRRTTPLAVLPLFPSAEEDHDQPGDEGAADAHGESKGVDGHIPEDEDSKDEAGPAPLPPTSPTPLWRKVLRGQTLRPMSLTSIWLPRTNPTP